MFYTKEDVGVKSQNVVVKNSVESVKLSIYEAIRNWTVKAVKPTSSI